MAPLLADEATVVFPELVAPLLVGTVAAIVLWLVLLLAAVASRPRNVDPGHRRRWTRARSRRRSSTCSPTETPA